MALALFDLDNTLLDGDSDYEWGNFLVSKKLVDADEYEKANTYFYEQYKQGTLDIVEFSAFSFKPLSLISREELNNLHQEFMQTYILPRIKPQTPTVLNKHKNQGDTLVIITATNSFITRPIATHLGIKHLIATEPKIIDGKYTTEIEGTPCFQEGKVTRLNDWLKKNNDSMEGSYFYSDSINDLPLLEIVDTPIVVDPDERLREVGTKRDWEITSFK
ncbi:HAD-IB family hydrolase [Cocleimonas sp. KMM 6892]|uniref:histidinol-phosphatase n=1 Tax=unclassified Cocleimonas TaxID=2639732 RepID=UPI002DBF2BFF|nr:MULTISPECIES: HAD family hydrolase [unclassified Cocleimonas]MEB8433965.1 HAD-IB family hydrolase [Cocleimonas sp. KMM 6892]MEC4716776.1 HAD-IB family hydrolase [Cocleimonas sp. KMM 6895]MEC4746069.1 HAD-IB family hydrolase [Cocleimonas sp. KMM 6896]